MTSEPSRDAKDRSNGGEYAADSAAAVCSLSAALVRLDGDRDLLLMLIGVYLEDSVQLTSTLQTAIDGRDAAGAERAAHSLKGLASNFDGMPAAEAALVIETSARQADWPTVIDALPKLELEVARLRSALVEHQQRQ